MDFPATLFYLLTLVFRGVFALVGSNDSARKNRLLPVAVFRFFPENRVLSFAFPNDEFVFQRVSDLFFRFPVLRFSDGRLLFGRSPGFLMLSSAPSNVSRNRQALFRP